MNSPSELRHALALIADDHKVLGNAVRHLSQLLATDAANLARILTALQDISVIAARHFVREEELMAGVDYPWLATHRLNHRWFQTFISDYQSGIFQGSIRINDDARRNIPNLIRFHVCCRDDEFEDWLAANHGWSQAPVWIGPVPVTAYPA